MCCRGAGCHCLRPGPAPTSDHPPYIGATAGPRGSRACVMEDVVGRAEGRQWPQSCVCCASLCSHRAGRGRLPSPRAGSGSCSDTQQLSTAWGAAGPPLTPGRAVPSSPAHGGRPGGREAGVRTCSCLPRALRVTWGPGSVLIAVPQAQGRREKRAVTHGLAGQRPAGVSVAAPRRPPSGHTHRLTENVRAAQGLCGGRSRELSLSSE